MTQELKFTLFGPSMAFSKYVETTSFIVFSGNCIFKPTHKFGTLFVNTIALTETKECPFFRNFFFGGGFAVSGFLPIFLRGMKKQKSEQNSKTETRPQDANNKKHLVLLQKRKADNTDMKQYNFSV